MAPKRNSSYGMTSFLVTILAHLTAIALITLVIIWLIHFREGLAFKSNNSAQIFNLHPLLMLLGFILIQGEAIIAYKTVSGTRKGQKLVHLGLHFIALSAGVIGIYAVFKFHHDRGIPDMYSLHSWLGISTICLFGLQWIFSFFAFWYPQAQQPTRVRLTPWHGVIGLVIFFMAILCAMTGLVEKFYFLGLRRTQEALVVNFIGLLILLFGVCVGITILLPRS